MESAWVLLTPPPYEADTGTIAVIADAEHARYVSRHGEDIEGLTPARAARIARELGRRPDTARGWLDVALVNIGLMHVGPVQASPDFQRAYESASTAARTWSRGWGYRSRQERLANEAQILDEWASQYPGVASGDVHDPDAELELAQLMLPPVSPGRYHQWMPFGVGDVACGFCDQEADGPLHSSATPLEFVARPFARSLLAKARLLQAGLTARQDARLRESLSDDIKKFCDIVTPDIRPPEVSLAALAAAPAGVNLYREAWHSQPRFDPGRSVFHVEHVVPVRSLRDGCIAATAEDDVVTVLAGVRVAWILKEEDRELSRLGYRTRRDRPDEAYREAGIELVPWYRHGR